MQRNRCHVTGGMATMFLEERVLARRLEATETNEEREKWLDSRRNARRVRGADKRRGRARGARERKNEGENNVR